MRKGCIIYCLAIEGEVQRLTDLAQRHGWTVNQTFTEHPATAPDRRAGLVPIRRLVAKGDFEAVVVPSLTMLGASLDDTVALIAKMAGGNVAFIADAEGIDTTTPQGAGWMTSVASMHGYKEKVRREKARAAQQRAMQAGIRFGRPPIPQCTIEKVRTALEAGHGIRPTARKTGVSPARVAREKAAMKGAGNVF